MNVREAKDFLVRKTAEQAALENVPLSDLERRMMYFTETDGCPEDPIALNDAFEAEHNSTEFETKVSKLLRNAAIALRKKTRNLHESGMNVFKNSGRETTTSLCCFVTQAAATFGAFPFQARASGNCSASACLSSSSEWQFSSRCSTMSIQSRTGNSAVPVDSL